MRTAAFCVRVGKKGKGYLLYARVVVERSSGANEEVCAVLVGIEGEYFLGHYCGPWISVCIRLGHDSGR